MVDNFVWEKVGEQIASWKEKFNISLPVSVNVSRSDIFDPTLVKRLGEIVEKNGLTPDDIQLEITESAYTEDTDKIISIIGELKDCGFEIEMDDFGSGYSSLNMISELPIDVLKMDMKFIRNVAINETDRRLVALILDIAKHLNLTVVAEGVENREQLKILKKAGCDMVQGYYFSRPVSADEFEELIVKEINTERE